MTIVSYACFAYGMQSSSTNRATVSSIFCARSLTRSRTCRYVLVDVIQPELGQQSVGFLQR